jgi:hypothetical protein
MRGWTSILAAVLLLGVAYWSYADDGLVSSALICAAAAAFFFFRGAQGLSVEEAGDASALIDFVKDPADAIVDTATDRLADWLQPNEAQAATGGEQRGFDPDAVIARHLEQRKAEAAAAPASAPAYRGFGRKGVQ